MTNVFDDLLLKSLRAATNPIALSGGYPVAMCFREINLVEIPAIMRKRQLHTGAALMEHWFLGKPFVLPKAWKAPPPLAIDPRLIPPIHINESIVTMKWALGFERTVAMQQQLRAAVLGHLGAASLAASQQELFANLAADGKFTDRIEQFGIGTARSLHKSAHINSRAVSNNAVDKLSDPLDDLYCALGAFILHIAGFGTVTPPDKKSGRTTHQVTVSKLGFYLRDAYDFNEDQPLGLWNEDGVSKVIKSGRVLVENASFRKWRDVFRRGGDFLIFSDVHWLGLPKPLVWQYQGK